MKHLIFTFALVFLTISFAKGSTTPWEINKLFNGQIIELKGVQFEMDDSTLKLDAAEALSQLKFFLLDNKSVVIELQGHTNGIPPHQYCDELSSKRAKAVRDYLIKEGVNPNNLIAKG